MVSKVICCQRRQHENWDSRCCFSDGKSNNPAGIHVVVFQMVKVITQLGFTFNAHQLQEAMEEVDKDHNHTLDFYEYLLVLDNIYRQRGKIFQVFCHYSRKSSAADLLYAGKG